MADISIPKDAYECATTESFSPAEKMITFNDEICNASVLHTSDTCNMRFLSRQEIVSGDHHHHS